jgi:glucan 1,3-beta-glucosidase
MKLSLGISVCLGLVAQVFAQSYWYETIDHQGVAPYNSQGTAYQVFRNVKDFGAKGTSKPLCFDKLKY